MMKRWNMAIPACLGLALLSGWIGCRPAVPGAATVTVRDTRGLQQALAEAKPGTRIHVAPGEYGGRLYFSNLRGEAGKPIVVAAEDPKNPPLIRAGGPECLHLSSVAYVELHDLHLTGATANGLNIDDGGKYEMPSHHVVLKGLKVTEVGPEGNRDAIKLSGLTDFRIENCTVERWGSGGSAIDMVGCHGGVIEGSTFRHLENTAATGVQCKGGTSRITIRKNRFENAGSRAVNIGGSTGLQYFRPPLREGGMHAEARDITVEGNTFIGSDSPVAFVGVDGAVVRFNTFYRPRRWALRILRETTAPGFVPTRGGQFTDNVIAFHSDEWREGGVNIGGNTEPKTFRFARNVWYCLDNPARSRPTLPVEEAGGVYGKDPQFRDPDAGDLRFKPGSPASGAGAEALPKSR